MVGDLDDAGAFATKALQVGGFVGDPLADQEVELRVITSRTHSFAACSRKLELSQVLTREEADEVGCAQDHAIFDLLHDAVSMSCGSRPRGIVRGVQAGHGPAPAASRAADGEVRVDVDAEAAPRVQPWLERARQRCVRWYPQVVSLLDTAGFAPPRRLSLRAEPTLGGRRGRVGTPAVTSGTVITVGADWVDLHPDDFGLVLHELVHVVQSYPNGDPWWVTEGIADWVRYQRFETADPRARPDFRGRSYRDGYAVTAAFLAWIEATYDVAIVAALNTAMRNSAWSLDLFAATVGTDVDELWARFEAAAGPGRALAP
jgi:hypothetical protein